LPFRLISWLMDGSAGVVVMCAPRQRYYECSPMRRRETCKYLDILGILGYSSRRFVGCQHAELTHN